MIDALRFFAVINLLLGCGSGIYTLLKFSVIDVRMGSVLYSYTEKVMNPVGVGLGIGLIFEGILGCIFLLVISSIADDVANMRSFLKKSESIQTVTGTPDKEQGTDIDGIEKEIKGKKYYILNSEEETLCKRCLKSGKKNELLYHRGTDSYYHEKCVD